MRRVAAPQRGLERVVLQCRGVRPDRRRRPAKDDAASSSSSPSASSSLRPRSLPSRSAPSGPATGTRRRQQRRPAFVEEATAAGLDHVYDGEFELLRRRRRGGIRLRRRRPARPLLRRRQPSRPRCSGTRARSAARSASRGCPIRPPTSTRSRAPTRSTSTATASPTSPCCATARTCSCAGSATAASSGPTRPGARRRRRLDDRVQRDVGGGRRPADAGLRQLPRRRLPATRTSSASRQQLVRPASPASGYGPPMPLDPGYCTLSMLFSDWDRIGPADLRVANDRHY